MTTINYQEKRRSYYFPVAANSFAEKMFRGFSPIFFFKKIKRLDKKLKEMMTVGRQGVPMTPKDRLWIIELYDKNFYLSQVVTQHIISSPKSQIKPT